MNDLAEKAKRAVAVLVYEAQVIDKEFGLLLFSEIRESPMRHVVINKILMLYFQWDITKMRSNFALQVLSESKSGGV